MIASIGLCIIAATVFAILRRVEVRLVLLLAALALGVASGDVRPVVREFLFGFTNEKFLLPLGTCMGFAYVLRHTECDQHLIHLLIRPLQRVRFLLIPGTVLIGVVVNIPIISQSSTTIAVGTVLIPVLQAARLSPVTIAAAIALGASIGGELLNPGAPELRTITQATGATASDVVARVWPLLLVHLAVTIPIFWWLSVRAEKTTDTQTPLRDDFIINPLKAIVPLVPVLLLFLTALPSFSLFQVPEDWLIGPKEKPELRDARLVGLAMIIGVVVAALSSPSKATTSAKVFFEGGGYALANITSLIVCANCFGEGVKAVGLTAHLAEVVKLMPGILIPLASLVPLGFAWVSGSGMASTQSTYGIIYQSIPDTSVDALHVGAVVSLSAATGRTLSPVAPVVLIPASMAGADPLAMVRRLAPAMLAGLAAVVVLAMLRG